MRTTHTLLDTKNIAAIMEGDRQPTHWRSNCMDKLIFDAHAGVDLLPYRATSFKPGEIMDRG